MTEATVLAQLSDADKIRLVEDHYQTFWSGDLDDIDRELSPDFIDAGNPGAIGPEPVKEGARMARAGSSDMVVTLDHALVCDEYVVTLAHWIGTHDGPLFGVAPTGRKVEFRALVVWRFDAQGRLCERHPFFDPAAAQALLMADDPATV